MRIIVAALIALFAIIGMASASGTFEIISPTVSEFTLGETIRIETHNSFDNGDFKIRTYIAEGEYNTPIEGNPVKSCDWVPTHAGKYTIECRLTILDENFNPKSTISDYMVVTVNEEPE